MKITIMFSIVAIIGLIFFGVLHEQVHVQIYNSYGIDAHVKYISDFPHMTTSGEAPCPNKECTLAHNINEVVGYTLESIYLLMMIAFVIIIMLMEEGLKND